MIMSEQEILIGSIILLVYIIIGIFAFKKTKNN